MRVLMQRVTRAEVTVEAERVGAIERGLLLFVGVTHDDDDAAIDLIAHKVANLRIFPDAADQMNRSALDRASAGDTVGLLVIPQFTLYADTRHGRRPSFTSAAPPDRAAPLIDRLIERLTSLGLPVASGRFGAKMAVSLVNDGPVTIWLDTADLRR